MKRLALLLVQHVLFLFLNLCRRWVGKRSRIGDENTNLFFFYKMIHDLTPEYLSALAPPLARNERFNLRSANNFTIPHFRTCFHSNSFVPSVCRAFNDLPISVKQAPTLGIFKRHLWKESSNDLHLTFIASIALTSI